MNILKNEKATYGSIDDTTTTGGGGKDALEHDMLQKNRLMKTCLVAMGVFLLGLVARNTWTATDTSDFGYKQLLSGKQFVLDEQSWEDCYNKPSPVSNNGNPAGFKESCPNCDASLSWPDCPTKTSVYVEGRKCAMGASAEYMDNDKYLWTETKQTCYLHGNYGEQQGCLGDSSHTPPDILELIQAFNSKIGQMVNVDVDGTTVEAVVGSGHGVLNSKCGMCNLIKFDGKYALTVVDGMSSWSLELVQEVNEHLGQKNLASLAQVPKVMIVKDDHCRQLIGLTN